MIARHSSRRWLWLVAVPSALVALMTYRFVFRGLENAFPTLLGQIEAARLAFLLHIVASPVALAIGAVQFFPRLRAARPVLWIATTAQAVRLAMARRFIEHRRWMERSYALTFAAVTLRLYLPFFFLGGMDYAQASIWLAWIAWVPNLLLVEGWMAWRDARRPPATAGAPAPTAGS